MINFIGNPSPEDYEFYLDQLSSWKKVSNVINTFSEQGLLKAISVELRTKKRLAIIKRLKGRFNVLRNKREDQELIRLIRMGDIKK